MAIDYSIKVEIDGAVSDDRKAEITRKIMEVLESETINAIAHAATFSSGGTDNLKLTITT